MKKILLLLFLVLNLSDSFAQKTVFGWIVDEYGSPLANVTIKQSGSKNYNLSSTDGSFHVFLEEHLGQKLIFGKSAYNSIEIELKENSEIPLRVTMAKSINSYRLNRSPSLSFIKANKQWHLGFYFDLMFPDFKAFENELGKENIDYLNRQDFAFGIELGFTKKRFYHGYHLGLSFGTNTDNDSITKEVNKSVFGTQIGYKIIDSKRLSFMPNLGIKWYKYRLFNYDENSKIPLNQHLDQRRDLDLRFNHIVGYLGGNLAFKLKPRNKDAYNNAYWSIGIYGGFLFKIHPHPIIYNKRSRLTSNEKVSIKNYNFGIHFTGNI